MLFDNILLFHLSGTILYSSPKPSTQILDHLNSFITSVILPSKLKSRTFSSPSFFSAFSILSPLHLVVVLTVEKSSLDLSSRPLLLEVVTDLETFLASLPVLKDLKGKDPSYPSLLSFFSSPDFTSSIDSFLNELIEGKKKGINIISPSPSSYNNNNHSSNSSIKSKEEGVVSKIVGGVREVVKNIEWFSRPVEEEEVERALPSFSDLLTQKNFSPVTAESLSLSVSKTLKSRRVSRLLPSSLNNLFRTELKNSLLKIFSSNSEKRNKILSTLTSSLSSSKNNNSKSKMEGIVKVVVLGVNGVGKSTTIAKLTHYLLNNNNSPNKEKENSKEKEKEYKKEVGLVACDTFRSGAIEQLRIHSNRLSVPLYSSDYGSDPAVVAAAGLSHLSGMGVGVGLVDTAGRLGNNRELMSEIRGVVQRVDADLVLMVAEAMAGSDFIESVKEFDKNIKGVRKKEKSERGVDGIIVSKCDSVGDKLGMIASVEYEVGIPVVMMGVGQEYEDLKVLDGKEVSGVICNI